MDLIASIIYERASAKDSNEKPAKGGDARGADLQWIAWPERVLVCVWQARGAALKLKVWSSWFQCLFLKFDFLICCLPSTFTLD